MSENWKLWKEKLNTVIITLEYESPEFQLAMFKNVIDDDGL